LNYTLDNDIALLAFDDGKANAIGHEFMDAMDEALSRAETEAKAVIISGREGLFSAGFDLKEIQKGGDAARAILSKGSAMFYRLYAYPRPVVAACTGHAIAAGAFMLLACDNRIGAKGAFQIGLNETSINATFPVFAIELAQTRLAPAYLTRAFIQSELFTPEMAVGAGFLDTITDPNSVLAEARRLARHLATLPADAYAKNKQDIRAQALQAIKASLT